MPVAAVAIVETASCPSRMPVATSSQPVTAASLRLSSVVIADAEHLSPDISGPPESVPPNTALVLIKPHAATAKVDALLVRRLAEWRIAVTERGETRVTSAIIDAHYGVIAKGASTAPTTLAIGSKGRETFLAKHGVEWKSAAQSGEVVSALFALNALHGDVDALARMWNAAEATSVRLAGGTYVRRLHDVLVVNGFKTGEFLIVAPFHFVFRANPAHNSTRPPPPP